MNCHIPACEWIQFWEGACEWSWIPSLPADELQWTLHGQSHLQLLRLPAEASGSSVSVDGLRQMKAQPTGDR